MSIARRISLYAMSGLYILAGFNHLWNPEFYVRIIPPGLPEPELLNVVSGLIEITLGVYLLEPRTRVLAAWGIVALLIAVFPANLYVAVENVNMETGEPGGGAGALNWVRIALQFPLWYWAWTHTRPLPGEDPRSG
ncbi:MAG: DoxX family protein [Myxococcota bacterium]|nr:DoxX family protein [Myxococcota bacterium]